MENYQNYPTYPDSGNSSPRSREIDFENTAPWDENNATQLQNQNYKVKFLCSYGGKIQPRSHDNQLSYVGGDTKIFAVDRNIKFNNMQAKLSALIDQDVTFKYQLPGEDLDALISVTNDDDLEHMMHEYDRMFRGCAKPARMRLFLFPLNVQRDVNSAASQDAAIPKPVGVQNNVDFLFGLERGAAGAGTGVAGTPPHVVAKMHDPVPEPVVPDDRSIGSDHEVNTLELQREIQRMQLGGRDQGMYRRKSEDNSVGGYSPEFYMQKMQDKGSVPVSVPPPGYWPEKQVPGGGGFPPAVTTMPPGMPEPSVYMIPGPVPGMVYHAPAHPGMTRPVAGQTSQGFYAMQRMGSGSDSGSGPGPNIYRDQPVYNLVQPTQPPSLNSTPPVTLPPQQQQPRMAAYTEGIAVGRTNSGGSSGGGVVPDMGGYAHVGYDSAGRQVYYQAPGGMVAPPQQQQPQQPYQGMGGVGTDVRTAGVMSQEAKVVTKVSQ